MGVTLAYALLCDDPCMVLTRDEPATTMLAGVSSLHMPSVIIPARHCHSAGTPVRLRAQVQLKQVSQI